MTISITPIYAALCGFLVIILALRVVLQRRKNKVGLGDGDTKELKKAIRVHGNAVEYLPLALILLMLFEVNTGQTIWVHIYGGVLVVARIAHAMGLTRTGGVSSGRFLGTLFTWLVIIFLSGHLLVTSF
jgi:hypothetical protein